AAPGPGEVRIRQHAIGLNFIDVYYRTGLYKAPGLPFIAGNEAAGEVIAVGPGVTHFHPGDRVAYYENLGGYATERNIAWQRLVKLPDHITYEQGAVLMLKGLTVWYLLHKTFKVEPHHRVLIHAAAGGIGLLACQWARALGAHVIGTVGSRAKADLALAKDSRERQPDTVRFRQLRHVPLFRSQRVHRIRGGLGSGHARQIRNRALICRRRGGDAMQLLFLRLFFLRHQPAATQEETDKGHGADDPDHAHDAAFERERLPNVGAALLVHLGVLSAHGVTVVERVDRGIVLLSLAPYPLILARRGGVKEGHPVAVLHAYSGELLEDVLALDARTHRLMNAVDPLRHDDRIAAVLTKQRPEIFYRIGQWLALCDIELMHLINDAQRVFELIRNAPLAGHIILVARERRCHVLRVYQREQLLHLINRHAQVFRNSLMAEAIEAGEHPSPLLDRRQDVVLNRVIALPCTRNAFIENQHVTISP
ncbi:MAG: alcohol dehydrogenase catalytic domain-containing protein, partial [Anaerococcus vaginalis]|nr:alcohol dehydrogenase catalytic domain-containing protein [Anaerococcus vaginalis]